MLEDIHLTLIEIGKQTTFLCFGVGCYFQNKSSPWVNQGYLPIPYLIPAIVLVQLVIFIVVKICHFVKKVSIAT
jgi:hypothetical protein